MITCGQPSQQAHVAHGDCPGRAPEYPSDAVAVMCRWFAKCDQLTTVGLPHPVLGVVPCCLRCAERVGYTVADLIEVEVVSA